MTTTTLLASTDGGTVRSESGSSYSAAQAGATLTVDITNTSSDIGGLVGVLDGDDNLIGFAASEAFYDFDLSGVPSGAAINSATLSLWLNGNSNTPPTIEARLFDWGTSLTTADWRTQAQLAACTLLASKASAAATGSYVALTSQAALATAVAAAIGGKLRIVVCSAAQSSGTYTAESWGQWRSPDWATTGNRPQLVVDYTAGGTTVSLGLLTETDTPLAAAAQHRPGLGITTETDTTHALALTRTPALGILAEADTAQSAAATHAPALGQQTETDTVQPAALTRTPVLGLLTEGDEPLAVAATHAPALGVLTDTSSAQPITVLRRVGLTLLSELDQLLALAANLSRITTRPFTGVTSRPDSGTTPRPEGRA